MTANNDFSFLTQRLNRSNPETDFFQLYTDKNFVKTLSDDDYKRDAILLNFEQRVWVYDIEQDLDNIKVFNSFYGEEPSIEYFMHDIYYREASKSSLVNSISCIPTLSFRTLLVDSHRHIKFGLPIHFGAMVRLYPIKEALVSMYISDCIININKNEVLDFFREDKCYYYNDHSDYSVGHRAKVNDALAVPLGNYFNKILYFSGKSEKERFSEALDFVESFLSDYNLILEYLGQVGLGLELHGQNLLVYIDNNGISTGRYLYRDLGQCTISNALYEGNKGIDEYYRSHYDFDFKSTQQIASFKVRAWFSIRSFILGFLFYNLDRYQKNNNLNFNAYKWGAEIIEKCDYIKAIY